MIIIISIVSIIIVIVLVLVSLTIAKIKDRKNSIIIQHLKEEARIDIDRELINFLKTKKPLAYQKSKPRD